MIRGPRAINPAATGDCAAISAAISDPATADLDSAVDVVSF
jgi:hypothetical protein